jgi:aspartokinase-like uncharacterized kinase
MALDAVVKLGGSLLAGGDLSGLMGALVEAASAWRLAVVPGGGGFADAVRGACARHSPSASAAHWMAILAMDQHAHLLAGVCPAARLVATPQELAAVAGARELPLLAPYAWLRAEDPLPHGWHVTSDSIAAWVAGRVGARRLVLLKSIEGVSTDGVLQETVQAGSPAALAGIVDEYFAEALAPGLECWVLSGRRPERLARLLKEGRAPGTRLRGR